MNISSSFYFGLSILALVVVLLFVLLSLYYLSVRVTSSIRLNMDELPPLLSRMWWLVGFFEFYICRHFSASVLKKRAVLLNAAGLEYFLKPTETYSLQCIGLTFAFCFAASVCFLAGFSLLIIFFVCFFLSILGWAYPLLWINDQNKKRKLEILRAMPSFMDILTLCCECGLSLNSAITNYCEKGPKGPLRSEMERALRDMKGGATRKDALLKLSVRMANADLSMFVSIVIQCEKLGVSLGEALRRFSEQKRAERFQRAEKLAMEAPMKIIGPLVIFIFPITFIVIAFPIVISAMENLK